MISVSLWVAFNIKRDNKFPELSKALSEGTYTLHGTWPRAGRRYGSAEAQVELSTDDDGNLLRVGLDLELPPTILEGTLTADSEPVPMAEVFLGTGEERAVTDELGQFKFVAIEPGTQRRVRVHVNGSEALSETADIICGERTTLELSLS